MEQKVVTRTEPPSQRQTPRHRRKGQGPQGSSFGERPEGSRKPLQGPRGRQGSSFGDKPVCQSTRRQPQRARLERSALLASPPVAAWQPVVAWQPVLRQEAWQPVLRAQGRPVRPVTVLRQVQTIRRQARNSRLRSPSVSAS